MEDFLLNSRYSVNNMLLSQNQITILITVILLLIPLAMGFERANGQAWTSRLWQPDYKTEPDRHTPLITSGTTLPTTLTESVTLTAGSSPYLLTEPLIVPKDLTLRIEPGVTIHAHEFTFLTIYGSLEANGTTTQPILFTTNELHPENQTWGGIILEANSHTTINHTTVEYGSPSISCLDGSTLNAHHLLTQFSLVGLYTESNNCHVQNSRLQALEYAIVTRNTPPPVNNNILTAGRQNVLVTQTP